MSRPLRLPGSEVHALLQSWAFEFTSVTAFEAALDKARIPLGQVHSLAEVAEQRWVQEWGAFVELGLQGTVVKLLKSPFRLSSRDVGPTFAAVRRGADNAAVLKGKLGMSDGEIQQLVAAGVLCSEGGDGDTRD